MTPSLNKLVASDLQTVHGSGPTPVFLLGPSVGQKFCECQTFPSVVHLSVNIMVHRLLRVMVVR